MSRSDYLKGTSWVKGEQKEWSPTVKTILTFIYAFIIGFLVLSPALLGLYWETLLPK